MCLKHRHLLDKSQIVTIVQMQPGSEEDVAEPKRLAATKRDLIDPSSDTLKVAVGIVITIAARSPSVKADVVFGHREHHMVILKPGDLVIFG